MKLKKINKNAFCICCNKCNHRYIETGKLTIDDEKLIINLICPFCEEKGKFTLYERKGELIITKEKEY